MLVSKFYELVTFTKHQDGQVGVIKGHGKSSVLVDNRFFYNNLSETVHNKTINCSSSIHNPSI